MLLLSLLPGVSGIAAIFGKVIANYQPLKRNFEIKVPKRAVYKSLVVGVINFFLRLVI